MIVKKSYTTGYKIDLSFLMMITEVFVNTIPYLHSDIGYYTVVNTFLTPGM